MGKSEQKRAQICLDHELDILSIIEMNRMNKSSLKAMFTKEQLVMLSLQLATQTLPEDQEKPYNLQILEDYCLKKKEMDLKLAFGLYNRDIYACDQIIQRMMKLHVRSDDIYAYSGEP